MITPSERTRRMLILWYALCEVREEIVERVRREIDVEDFDWLARERFEAALDENRRMFRALDESRLQAAHDAESASVRCTPEERSAARRLANELLEGELLAETAVDRLWSEGFPHDVSARGCIDG